MKLKAAIFIALALCSYASANPEGGTVVSGDVDIQTDGLNLNITASDRAIIEWQDFSIDAGETTRFFQPSSNAAVLNQVTSNVPSSILGNLLSNGNVYLVNPNGIVVGATGVINTGGFIATTLDQGSSGFFENGELELLGDSDAAIVNLGNITATGDIFLVAAKIESPGVVHSTGGIVGLAAGKYVLLKEAGNERIFIRPVGEGEIDISGTIDALNIEIRSRGNAYSTAINLDGQLTATKVNEVGGRIYLSADEGAIQSGPDAELNADSIVMIADELNLGFDQVDISTSETAIFAGSISIGGSVYLVNPRGFAIENARLDSFSPLNLGNPVFSPTFSNVKESIPVGSLRGSPLFSSNQQRSVSARFTKQISDSGGESVINLNR